MRRYLHVLGVCLAFLLAGLNVWSEETSPPSVLYVASERHTSLALNYVYFPQFARLGFGTPDAPWHPWFGTRELLTLLYLPGYERGRGQAFEVSPRTVIGSGFAGKVWESGFEALRQFDADQNGVVEADELNDLYVWRDADSSGTFEAVVRTGRKDEIIACHERFAGFDLRTAAVRKSGYAREGLLAPFAVFRSHRSRIHLLEFAIRGSFTDRFRGYLSYAGTQQVDPDHRFSGEWRWEMNAQRGRLLLAASGREIRGIVQYEGRPCGHHQFAA